jgi:hypothetical protein
MLVSRRVRSKAHSSMVSILLGNVILVSSDRLNASRPIVCITLGDSKVTAFKSVCAKALSPITRTGTLLGAVRGMVILPPVPVKSMMVIWPPTTSKTNPR